MKGDYYRYLAEVAAGDDKKGTVCQLLVKFVKKWACFKWDGALSLILGDD